LTALAAGHPDGSPELAGRTPMMYAFWVTVILLIAAIVVRHLTGGMAGHH
jgi:hypothetical protein